MGDLGVIALFAPPEVATLPLLMQRLMAAYRMQAAAGVGLVLVVLTYALFWVVRPRGAARCWRLSGWRWCSAASGSPPTWRSRPAAPRR